MSKEHLTDLALYKNVRAISVSILVKHPGQHIPQFNSTKQNDNQTDTIAFGCIFQYILSILNVPDHLHS